MATRKRTSTGTRTSASAGASGRASPGAGAGLRQKVRPDQQLAAVVGSTPLPRTEVVKKFWSYVKDNGLQAREDRRRINADDKLRPIFGGKRQVSMFEVARLLAAHAR
jgi:upstream activation factor subunit UAF30